VSKFRSDAIEQLAKAYAPARLARADVAMLRDLYDEASAVRPTSLPLPADRPTVVRTIFAARDRRMRVLGLLGKDLPAAVVYATWNWTNSLCVRADAVYPWAWVSVDSHHKTYTVSQSVAEHRFGSKTSRSQFLREVSFLVRHGLGYVRHLHAIHSSNRPATQSVE
jgi:hypothetical protein